jgi:hypothetical protein
MDIKSLPEDLKNIIIDKNGKKKKVIFFNTSLKNILEFRDDYIKKLSIFLDLITQRDDTLLWWRPRPFSEDEYSFFEKTDPEIMESYKKIVKKYRSEKLGVFDDTPELERAIVLSDAYYGDFSAVAERFEIANKRVIIWNMLYPELDVIKYNQIARTDYDGFRYSILHEHNILVKTDLRTLKSEYFGNVPFLGYFAHRAFHRMYTYNNRLVFIPFETNILSFYSFDTGIWSKFELKIDEKLAGDNRYFMQAIFHNDKLYLLPINYRGIIAFDFSDCTAELATDLSSVFPIGVVDPWLVEHCFMDDNRYLIISNRKKALLIFCTDTYKVTEIKTEEIYSAAYNYGGEIWLVSRLSGAMTKWTEETNTFDKYEIDIDGFCNNYANKNKMAFDEDKRLFEHNGWLYLFAFYANMCVRFNFKTHIFERLSELDEFCKPTDEVRHAGVTDGMEIEGSTVYLSNRYKFILEYNAENRKTRIAPMRPEWSESEIEILNARFIDALCEH